MFFFHELASIFAILIEMIGLAAGIWEYSEGGGLRRNLKQSEK